MAKLRVGVLRGGPSAEYEVSLKTGAFVLSRLPPEKYQPRDILLTREGEWFMEGLPASPERLRHAVDIVFNALHGSYGEAGQVQRYLDSIGLPYTGNRESTKAPVLRETSYSALGPPRRTPTRSFAIGPYFLSISLILSTTSSKVKLALTRNSLAPSCLARSISSFCPRFEKTTTGTTLSSALALSFPSTSKPSSPGRSRSRKMRSGLSCAAVTRALSPSTATATT